MAKTVKAEPEAPQSPSARVLEFLHRHPNEEVSPKAIGEELELRADSVSAALQYLARTQSQLVNRKRGVWVWQDEVPSVQHETKSTEFKVVTTHRTGGVVLKDDNGDLWLAQPIHVEIWPVLNALGFTGGEEQPAGILRVMLDPSSSS